MPPTHTADFQTAALKATDLDAVEKVNVGLETELVKKHVNIIADAPEIRIQDKTGSSSETTMSIVADGGATHFRAGIDTFAEGSETKSDIKFQSSTGATTHAEIVGSSGKLELQDGGLGLKRGSNVSVSGTASAVIQEITGPHARESAVLKKYPEVVFADGKFDTTQNENVSTYWAGHSTVFQGGYSVKTSTHSTDDGGQFGWHTFDDNPGTKWKGAEDYDTTTGNYDYGFTGVQSRLTDTNSTNHDGDHVIMGSPNKLKIAKVSVTCKSSNRRVVNYSVLGSNSTGTTGWTLLNSGSFTAQDTNTAMIASPTTHFKYHAFVVRSVTPGVDGQRFQVNSIHYYGYEEVGAADDSVDTTVKSVYNAPDLTSAALYIDATKPDSNESVTDQSGSGVTVTAVAVTHDSTENAWELTGAATSNIVSGNLTGLVGDHPHSVSAWVKADQLNGSGLFHVGTADGEGDAASRVGFVDDSHISWGGEDHFFSNSEWHNVTYVYNGEGSDKKLFLDGRHVGTAKNEDTFGEFPPFAMSTYSEYGYTVSASTDAYTNGSFKAWKAFNNTIGNEGWHAGEYNDGSSWNTTFNATDNAYSGTRSLGGVSGEWLKLELPFPVKLSYLMLAARDTSANPQNQSPEDIVMMGSNDDVHWTTIKTVTGLTPAADDEYDTIVTNAQRAYKYIAMVCTKVFSTGGFLSVGEIRYFGHRENDLVRFPDSVNTLRYPHVAMTGPAQRGYVATASRIQDRDAYKAFDNTYGESFWSPDGAGLYYTGTDRAFNSSASNSSLGGIAGEWIKMQTPRAIVLSEIKLWGRQNTAPPHPQFFEDFTVLGSNDDTNWTTLKTVTGATDPSTGSTSGTTPYSVTGFANSNAYKYIGIVVTRALINTTICMSEIQLYGTEENSDVIARVGDGFDGKVRNLRVYSTALSDARVQEIFDADKDEFGLAKSSVSVYRGHLGIGTSEPEAALTVMDEVAELEEFPPRGISVVGVSAATLDVKQHIEGHGVFRMSTSSNHGSAGSVPGAFDKQTNTYWHAAGGAYSGTGSSYPTTGTSSLAGIRGDWLRLELPYKVKLSSIGIRARSGFGNQNTYDQSPEDFTILGNNDNGIWTVIQSFTGKSWSDTRSTTIPITTDPSAYNSFAIVTTRVGNSSGLTIAELRYFGTREQGASTLHNGELSLTRNLTVPRIGPPLDADDTPRRDRLVLEYNTTTDPTENGVVKDTSGAGNDGQMVGATNYNSSSKGLVLSNSNTSSAASNYITRESLGNSEEGNFNHSVSLWFTMTTGPGSSYRAIFEIGPYPRSNGKDIALYVTSDSANFLGFASGGNTLKGGGVPGNARVGRAYHIVIVYDGAKKYMYIDGVLDASDNYTTFDGVKNMTMRIGRNNHTNGNEGIDGTISNFKMYVGHALTSDEVRRLYDMGRCDEGHHTTVVSRSKLQMRGEQLILEPCIKGFYEEGTWTPLIGGHTSGRKTPGSSNYGWFIRVGNLVTIGGTVAWSGGDSLVGHIVIDGIPYTATSTVNARVALSFGVIGSGGITTSSGYNTLRLVLDPGYPYIWFMQANEEGSTTVTYSHSLGVASSGQIYGIGGSYKI